MSFGMAYATKKHNKKMNKGGMACADGGMIEESPEMESEASGIEDADMIARIMHKRKEYSKGGMVANDVGVAEADKLPAEYDDLVLRDDLEGEQPEDSNEHGDVISKIMSKRKK